MNRFVLHPEAYTDLEEIWEHIASDNLDAADRILEEIYEAIQALGSWPPQSASNSCHAPRKNLSRRFLLSRFARASE
jgi:plasmid stabilization system protein ParE